MIKVVLIDVDNTLLDFNKCADESMLWCAEKVGITFPKGYLETFFSVNDPLWEKIEKGELTREGLYEVRWNMIFEKLGLNFDGPEFEDLFRERIKSAAVPVEGAPDLMKYLHGKYTVCVASNTVLSQQKMRLEKAGMAEFVKEYFTSEKIGFPKPAPEFFEACFSAFEGVRKDEVIFIGDSISADIEGAGKFGFKTCWYNHNSLPMSACKNADYKVNKLREIMDIL